ncbi:MAG: hypothetical protein RRY79_04340 [Clostridia bacterium]
MLFEKKEIDMTAANIFWKWFSTNEALLLDACKASDENQALLLDAGELISAVFPYYRKELDFTFTFESGLNKFNIYHKNNKYLEKDTKALFDCAPLSIKSRWNFDAKV